MNNALFGRRNWLRQSACGFGSLALSGLAAGRAAAESPKAFDASGVRTDSTGAGADRDPLSARSGHHPARAKRVIFLFMQGGVSHIDSWDHKPLLAREDGKQRPFDDARTVANTGNRGTSQRVMKSPWAFHRHGRSGHWGSDLFPAINGMVDDLCFLHGMQTEGVAHGPATLFLHCGSTAFVRPSMGSWVLYGLGTENRNLPGFVSIGPSTGNGGARNYGSAFLPALYQGTALGRAGGPVRDMTIRNVATGGDLAARAERFELLRELHAERLARSPADAALEAVAESYELAWRLQANAPDALDVSRESAATRRLYGIDEEPTDGFGRQCLMARRLCEAGVRFVQVTYGDGTANPAWDQHSNLPKHADHARAVDQPVAALLTDLKARGLLEDTIVWFGSEFGRTPYAEKNGTGRDHNPGGFTVWVAGGGFKPGFSFGATDEFGARAIEGRTHMHDLHATILHQLGLDHEKLTFRYAGRDFRLTDVHGHVVREVLA